MATEQVAPGCTASRTDCTCGSEYDAYCPRDGWRTPPAVGEVEAAQAAETDAANGLMAEQELSTRRRIPGYPVHALTGEE